MFVSFCCHLGLGFAVLGVLFSSSLKSLGLLGPSVPTASDLPCGEVANHTALVWGMQAVGWWRGGGVP